MSKSNDDAPNEFTAILAESNGAYVEFIRTSDYTRNSQPRTARIQPWEVPLVTMSDPEFRLLERAVALESKRRRSLYTQPMNVGGHK